MTRYQVGDLVACTDGWYKVREDMHLWWDREYVTGEIIPSFGSIAQRKRMVVAVTPLTVSFDKTWHSCPDCDSSERGVCEHHDYLNTVHNASVYQGV